MIRGYLARWTRLGLASLGPAAGGPVRGEVGRQFVPAASRGSTPYSIPPEVGLL